MANSVVPKFTVIIGNSYGAGNYAMCGKAFDPRLIVAWPSAEMAVMGGAQAAKVLMQIESAALKKKGVKVAEKDQEALFKKLKSAMTCKHSQPMLLHAFGQTPLLIHWIPESGSVWG